MDEQENIYKAPEAELVDGDARLTGGVVPASRWARLGGSLLDTIVIIIAVISIILISSIWNTWIIEDESLLSKILAGTITIVCWMACNFHLMITRGQTIGKMIVKTQVVDFESGRIPNAGQSVGTRFVIPQLIGTLFNFFLVVDALFIFRKDRRCIHDLMAKTKVVKYQNSSLN